MLALGLRGTSMPSEPDLTAIGSMEAQTMAIHGLISRVHKASVPSHPASSLEAATLLVRFMLEPMGAVFSMLKALSLEVLLPVLPPHQPRQLRPLTQLP